MTALNKYRKWDIVLVSLDPTIGSEIAKTRPCLIVSPDVININMKTVIVVPFTSKTKNYPFRIPTFLEAVPGELCFDHLRSIDKRRIIKKNLSLINL